MRQFQVKFHSLREVHAFVDLCTKQPFQIMVGNDRHQVNATNFMGLFSLNCRTPLTVMPDCTEEAYDRFRREAEMFLVNE